MRIPAIEDLFQAAGLEIRRAGSHHHARPGWIQLDCPFCGPKSGRYHLGFNLQRGYFSCWRCGGLKTGPVCAALGIPFPKIEQALKDLAIPAKESPPPNRRLQEPPGRGPLLPAHQAYLRSRGLDPEQVTLTWHLEGTGIAPRLSWRIYIPIYLNGRRVSWTTRAIGNGVPLRYISASATEEEVPHKDLIYGWDFCQSSIVIVEGPVDAWKIGPGAGATFGITVSTAQIRWLAKIPYRTICFDNEPQAQKRAEALCHALAPFHGMTQNVQLDAPDPGEASPKEIRLLRRIARL